MKPISSTSSTTSLRPHRFPRSSLSPPFRRFLSSLSNSNPNSFSVLTPAKPCSLSLAPLRRRRSIPVSASPESSNGIPIGVQDGEGEEEEEGSSGDGFRLEVRSPSLSLPSIPKLSLSDRAFFLFAFIACTTSVAFTSLVIAAVPTLFAMGRAATSLSKLADTAREELPSTMAAIRLSGMEISDLTLELSDLSQEISDGVSKSSQAVKAAEAGIRHIGALAHQQTMSMIEERANLPVISLKPVVVGAAKKTSQAVGKATKSLMNMISGGEDNHDEKTDDNSGTERVDM